VIEVKVSGTHEIEIRGSGVQTRSFMYIDDCLKGIDFIMNSEILEPINLGSSESVTVNQLVDIVEEIAGIKLKRRYDLSAPKGCKWAKFGQHADSKIARVAAGCPAADRHGKNLPLDYDQYLACGRGDATVVRESFAASD
jgi:nucleoside-diphosphate-sugar epimerase